MLPTHWITYVDHSAKIAELEQAISDISEERRRAENKCLQLRREMVAWKATALAYHEAKLKIIEKCALYHDEQRVLMHDLIGTGHEDDDVLRVTEEHHKASAAAIRAMEDKS